MIDAASSQLLVNSIKEQNEEAALEILKKCLEKDRRGFEAVLSHLGDDEKKLVESYIQTDQPRNLLTGIIENKIRQIDNYFTAVDSGLWP